jgi:hypothetical protein
MDLRTEIAKRARALMESGGLPEVGGKAWHQYLEKIRYYYTWMPHTLPQHVRELLDSAKAAGQDPIERYSKSMEVEVKLMEVEIERIKAMEEKENNTVH